MNNEFDYYNYYLTWSTESLVIEKNIIEKYMDEIDILDSAAEYSAAWKALNAIYDILQIQLDNLNG